MARRHRCAAGHQRPGVIDDVDPVFTNGCQVPNVCITGNNCTGTITLPDGVEMCMPGDNTVMTVNLIHPIAMEEGLRFAIREGGRTVGAGRVTKILK